MRTDNKAYTHTHKFIFACCLLPVLNMNNMPFQTRLSRSLTLVHTALLVLSCRSYLDENRLKMGNHKHILLYSFYFQPLILNLRKLALLHHL